jgi:DNA-binding XRE family transcriptional regulator
MEPDEFRTFRIELGLTQADLAQIFQVTPRTIHNWETGHRPIRALTSLALERLRTILPESECN